MKILVAEDERITRRNIQRHLAKWGHQVITAENGAVAWEILQEQEDTPIVITDWVMPEVDGLELIRRIRLCQREYYIYVILLTTKSEKRDIVEGMEAGADDFLSKPFDRNELRVRLRAGIRIIDLERSLAARNQEIYSANSRMKRDLDAAAVLQQSLLPTALPDIPGLQFSWAYQPCDELAGDILNVFRLDQEHVGFYLADVSGHGVPAALLSVTISRVLSPELSQSSLLFRPDRCNPKNSVISPAQVATELNRQFQMTQLDRRYFSLVYGVLNTNTWELSYVPAGHPPLLLVPKSGESRQLSGRNVAIGWFPDADFAQYTVSLNGGDRIYLYSDGITETMNSESEQFGDEQLMRFLMQNRGLPLEENVNQLLRAIRHWCAPHKPRDDISILAIEIHTDYH